MRLFIALCLDEACKNRLCGAMEGLRSFALQAQCTRRENLHLTLAFLGEVPGLEGAQAAMAGVRARPFRLELGGLGRFERPEGDLWWMGVQRNPALEALQKQLCAQLRRQGFRLEERPFRPHLTLARRVRLGPGFAPRQLADRLPPAGMAVERISLMESSRPQGRLVYTERWSLALKEV